MTLEELNKDPEDVGPEDVAAEDAEVVDDVDLAEEDEAEAEDAALPDDEEEGDQASLDELIAQRAAGRRGADDADDDSDIMALASEPEEPVLEPLPGTKVAPIRDQKEFVCKSCYLVKPRVQLADAKREYCRDCV